MKRFALLIFFLLFTTLAHALDVLILLNPERTGSSVDEHNYIHGEWVLWPAKAGGTGGNRLLSLLSGMDWASSGEDTILLGQGTSAVTKAFGQLQKVGYFDARERVVAGPTIVIQGRKGTTPRAMLLGLSFGQREIVPLPLDKPWPKAQLAVGEADSWDEVAAIVHKVDGKVLVVEYPPKAPDRWSHLWLRGKGWSGSLPQWEDYDVPGLVPASEVGSLLLHPERFRWVEYDASNWGGANRWLDFTHYLSPLLITLVCCFAVFFIGSTIYLVSRDERASFGVAALKALTMVPASILVGGVLSRMFGLGFASAAATVALAVLVVGGTTLSFLLRFQSPKAHPLFGFSVVGLAATLVSPPLWGAYSNVLGFNTLPISPEAAGSLFLYLTAASAFSRGSIWIWPVRFTALAIFLFGIALDTWWAAGVWPFVTLPAVAVLVGEGRFRTRQLPFLALIPLADGKLAFHGFTWAPGGLLASYDRRESLNLARYVEFFASPGFVLTFVLTGLIAVFVERYFFHHVRRTFFAEPRSLRLFQGAAAVAAMGLLQPLLLYVALLSFVAGLVVLLTDAARTA